MAVSLYDLSVSSYLQTLGALEGILSKGLTQLPRDRNQSQLHPPRATLRGHGTFRVSGVEYGARFVGRRPRSERRRVRTAAADSGRYGLCRTAEDYQIISQARGEMLQLQRDEIEPDFQFPEDKVVAYQRDRLWIGHFGGWIQVYFGVMTFGDIARLR